MFESVGRFDSNLTIYFNLTFFHCKISAKPEM